MGYEQIFMQKAFEIANKSEVDVPVGAVLVFEGKILAQNCNQREKNKSPISHAEVLVIEEGSRKLDNWRLEECDLYVTLEPCPMCASLILQTRIKNIYFGAYDNKYGALGSVLDMRDFYSYKTNVRGGFMEQECTNLLKNFFENKRG